MKEVDLEKSISDWLSEGLPNDEELIDYIKETAEHFFELGLKAQKGKENFHVYLMLSQKTGIVDIVWLSSVMKDSQIQ